MKPETAAEPRAGSIGTAAALRALGRTALDVVRTRISLFSLELGQESARLGRLSLYAGLALLAVCLFLQLLAVLAVAWFWDTPHRLLALACVGGLFGCMALASLLALSREMRGGRRAFEGTLQALAADLGEAK